MTDLISDAHDLVADLKPDNVVGAIVYLIAFVIAAMLLSRALRVAVHAAMTRQGHIDRTTISFAQQFGSAMIWVIMLILYAHLIPVLRAMGTALLAGASVASVVIGLAAQSTLGNLVAGIAITLYRPFRLGDNLQVAAPTGTEVGTVEMISLGYTSLRAADGRMIVLPNSLVAGQATINLSAARASDAISVTLRVARSADLDAVRRLATAVAEEVAGASAVDGCFVKGIEANAAVFELKLRAPDPAHKDDLRSTLMARLAERFASDRAAGGASGEPATFS